jgi:M6 family metalloprotease-like protein
MKRFTTGLALSLVTLSLSMERLFAATLADFGYRSLKANTSLSLGTRPLLVVLANFAGGNPLTNTPAFYDSVLFTGTQNVNGYFFETSNGRFSWTRAGVVYSPRFSTGEKRDNYASGVADSTLRTQVYYSNIIAKLMLSNVYNFRQHDANGDNEITDDELEIMISGNDDTTGHRYFGRVQPPGVPYAISGNVTDVAQFYGFYTAAHELTHGMGTEDLYGSACLSRNLTMMSCETTENDTFHLDPCNKMRIGWAEPRLLNLNRGGAVTLSAAQLADPTAPVILYDPTNPNHDTNEFFMLEYRTQTSPLGGRYDRNVASSGLAIWHIQLYPWRQPTQIPSLTVSNGIDIVDFTLGAPNLNRGGGQLWESGTITPYLRWLDGTATRSRIRVRLFNPGDGQITVDVLTDGDTWVDFNYAGVENGTFGLPWNTLAEGVAFSNWGGFVNFKPGSRPETAFITKPMTLRAPLGTARIGQ